MKIKNKKFLFITLNENLYNRQKYIIESLKEYIDIDTLFLENIFKNYSFFYKKGYYQNSFWPDSYSFQYFIFKKIFLENIDPKKYSGLIVTYDWSASIKRTIQIFKEFDIPTFNILHEGFFINIKNWYNMNKYLPIKLILKTKKGLDIPSTDFSFVWWKIHKKTFIKRGYKGKLFDIGTFKFEKYKKISIDKKKILEKLNINKNKKIFLYVFQILNEKYIHYQYKIINDLIQYCNKNNITLIIRNQLGYDLNLSLLKNINNNIIIDGINLYKITAEESILISDKVFSINSTMLLEAIYNNKDAFSIKYFNFKSPFLNNKIIIFINNKEELDKKINFHIDENFKNKRNIELKKINLKGNINKLINIIDKNTKEKNYLKSNKNKIKNYYLKYFYILINPFLMKNFIQSLIIKLGKKS